VVEVTSSANFNSLLEVAGTPTSNVHHLITTLFSTLLLIVYYVNLTIASRGCGCVRMRTSFRV
jgi:hypothetical protein